MKKRVSNIYDRFLNRIQKDRAGDVHIIVGIELILVAIAFIYKFFASGLSEILKIENNTLFLTITISLCFLLLIGFIVTLRGIVIKTKK